MSAGHSPTGASGMARWEPCPGSVALSATIAQRGSSTAAEEGTAAHDLAAIWLETGLPPVFPDLDMFHAVGDYVVTCNRFYTPEQQRLGAVRGVETRFDHSATHPGVYGTADYWVYWPWLKHLVVIDFKYGAGKFVEAQNNPQGLYYVVGLAMAHPEFDIATAEIGIVQPRCRANTGIETTRFWNTDWFEIEKFKTRMLNAIARTNEPNAPLQMGDHCIFCPAKAICPEQQKERDMALTREFVFHKGAQVYDVRELAKALSMREALRAYLKALDEFAYAEMKAGVEVPGFKLVEKLGQRKYKDEALTLNTLRAAGFSDAVTCTKPELLSPAQLEKAVPSFKELLQEHTVKESSGLTVVESSDKRQAVKVQPEKEFHALTLESLGL